MSASVRTLAVVQSSYIPWKGYFDLINAADEFILYDDVQYSHGTWRNRNRIKTASGSIWLTIPVRLSGHWGQRIDEIKVADARWTRKHWASVQQAYGRTPYFPQYAEIFASLYAECADDEYLSTINYRFLITICQLLDISTPISWSTDYTMKPGKSDRLVDLCLQTNCRHYLSGPSAQDYLDEQLFAQAGITVSYADYSGYPQYRQPYPPFVHEVSILDLLFCEGPKSREFLKSTSRRDAFVPH